MYVICVPSWNRKNRFQFRNIGWSQDLGWIWVPMCPDLRCTLSIWLCTFFCRRLLCTPIYCRSQARFSTRSVPRVQVFPSGCEIWSHIGSEGRWTCMPLLSSLWLGGVTSSCALTCIDLVFLIEMFIMSIPALEPAAMLFTLSVALQMPSWCPVSTSPPDRHHLRRLMCELLCYPVVRLCSECGRDVWVWPPLQEWKRVNRLYLLEFLTSLHIGKVSDFIVLPSGAGTIVWAAASK